ncbi:hypothetical protein [Paracoccus sp. (in: a-proteobacteria)]|uniref:hypothetical protein n=1 Tax=Paracoccus sp. TaxID=267 RepID=UPI003A8BFC42
MMRKIGLAILVSLALAAPSAAEDRTAKDPAMTDYPKLEVSQNAEGKTVPTNWPQVAEDEWRAVPDDPASPRYIEIEYDSASIDPAEALKDAERRAEVELTDAATREVTTWEAVEDGKAWATAASAEVGGTEHSVFVITYHSKARGAFSTDYFSIPTANYREWGGVMMYMQVLGMTPYLDGLPEGFADSARYATNTEQAEVFAGLIDITMTKAMKALAQAQAGALSALRNIGNSMNERGECLQLSYCNYNWTTGEAEYHIDN